MRAGDTQAIEPAAPHHIEEADATTEITFLHDQHRPARAGDQRIQLGRWPRILLPTESSAEPPDSECGG